MKLNIMYILEMWLCPGTKDAGRRVRALAAAWNVHQVLTLGVGLKLHLMAIAGKSFGHCRKDCLPVILGVLLGNGEWVPWGNPASFL